MLKCLPLIALLLVLAGCDASPKDDLGAYAQLSAKQLYANAKRAQDRKHFEEAIKQYRALDRLYPTSKYAKQALLNTIEANYLSDNEDGTQAAAEQYLHLYPNGDEAAYAYFMHAMIGIKQHGSWLQRRFKIPPEQFDLDGLNESFTTLDYLVVHFPKSRYVPRAVRMMKHIRYAKANHELETAHYYFQQNAYLAAVNRAREAIALDAAKPIQQQGYQLMLKCYQKLGDTAMAAKVKRALARLH